MGDRDVISFVPTERHNPVQTLQKSVKTLELFQSQRLGNY